MKKISKEDAKKFYSNTKMLDGLEDSEESLFMNNQNNNLEKKIS